MNMNPPNFRSPALRRPAKRGSPPEAIISFPGCLGKGLAADPQRDAIIVIRAHISQRSGKKIALCRPVDVRPDRPYIEPERLACDTAEIH
jgi:hypothetical protein